MEKHKCKLCFRNFANGRALGGHMRSHMMNLPIPPKRNESAAAATQLSFEAESGSSPSSSSYVLRDNPKRSFRFADSKFLDAGSVILMDRESETESLKNPTGRRSQRTQKPNESASSNSSSETTTEEEDIAFCLIMMSQDNKWNNNRSQEQEEEEEDEDEEQYEDEDEEESDDESEEVKVKGCKQGNRRVRGRYKCDTCNKNFRSYQALGGHRASHKKMKIVKEEQQPEHVFTNGENSSSVVVVPLLKKIHECPVCLRVFGSGQALGGHKRTHVIGSIATANVTAATATTTTTEVRNSVSFIDLNLPAPMDDDDDDDDDDYSAVSDAEFVKPR